MDPQTNTHIHIENMLNSGAGYVVVSFEIKGFETIGTTLGTCVAARWTAGNRIRQSIILNYLIIN